jgi:hypothetical protein
MPLPWRKKWSIHYLYQPPLTAQLGVFGNGLTPLLFNRFLQAVPAKFRYWDFSLNHQNVFSTEGFPLYQRKNFVLPLNQPYGILWKGYRENIRRNIKKSRDYGCQVKKDVHPDQVIDLVKFSGQKGNAEDIGGFAVLFQRLKDEGMACTYGIVSDKGDLLSSAVFLFSHQRAYYILVGNHPNGRTLGASHALIDAFIQDHAGKDMALDFEGSDIRNLAFFLQLIWCTGRSVSWYPAQPATLVGKMVKGKISDKEPAHYLKQKSPPPVAPVKGDKEVYGLRHYPDRRPHNNIISQAYIAKLCLYRDLIVNYAYHYPIITLSYLHIIPLLPLHALHLYILHNLLHRNPVTVVLFKIAVGNGTFFIDDINGRNRQHGRFLAIGFLQVNATHFIAANRCGRLR